MKANMNIARLALTWMIPLPALLTANAQPSMKAILRDAESHLKSIYEEGEFQAKTFTGTWLADSSGYTVMERDPDGKEERVLYEVATGNRTVERSQQDEVPRGNRSPDGRWVLHSDRGVLRVQSLESGKTQPLTENPPDEAVRIFNAAWSPDGTRIAFVQADSSKIRLRPMLVPGDPSYPEVRETRFARVGGAIQKLQVGVVDATGGPTRWIKISEPGEDFYLGMTAWAGNSEELLVEKLSRFRDRRQFLLCNVRTGTIQTLFEESDPAWVVASVAKNSGLEWIRDGSACVVISEKDGWRHAYVYSRQGKEEKLLTPGEWDIIERVQIDEERGWYYFNASPDNGTQKYLFRAPLNGDGKPERVTPEDQPGTHDYDFSPDSRWAFHTYSRLDQPPVTELVEFPGHRVVRMLEDNQALREAMKGRVKHATEFLQLDIGGGVVMDAWMIKPSDFNPAKKYPVFVYVYGEPHAQTVLDRWGGNHIDYHRTIANLGYLVVSIDNRGTPAPKGAAWRRAVFGSLGPLSTEEQAEGLKELARQRPYVDLSRVGIWGWSGGGSNTLNALFRRPDVYHVGIAVAPKPQPHLYNAWFQEIYMETVETNPDGYRRAAAIHYAEGLEGDLLIIHGSGETNTHMEIVEGLVDRLIELGKPFDFMVYPNRDHGIREGKGTSVHLRMHMIRYLLNHLQPGPR